MGYYGQDPNPRKALKFKVKPVPGASRQEWNEVQGRIAHNIKTILEETFLDRLPKNAAECYSLRGNNHAHR